MIQGKGGTGVYAKEFDLTLFLNICSNYCISTRKKILPLPKSEQNEENSGYNSDLAQCITGYIAAAVVVEIQLVSLVEEKACTKKNPLGIKMWF